MRYQRADIHFNTIGLWAAPVPEELEQEYLAFYKAMRKHKKKAAQLRLRCLFQITCHLRPSPSGAFKYEGSALAVLLRRFQVARGGTAVSLDLFLRQGPDHLGRAA